MAIRQQVPLINRREFFCFRDHDLNPIALIYKLCLDILNIYLHLLRELGKEKGGEWESGMEEDEREGQWRKGRTSIGWSGFQRQTLESKQVEQDRQTRVNADCHRRTRGWSLGRELNRGPAWEQ